MQADKENFKSLKDRAFADTPGLSLVFFFFFFFFF
jgi:hypothetical protein